MGDQAPTTEAFTLQHNFTQSIKHVIVPTYEQDTWLNDPQGQDKLVGHMGACVEDGRLVIGEGGNVVTVDEAFRSNGVASKMFEAFILNIWNALPDKLRAKMNVIMRNGEAGNDKLLQWLISLGVDRSRVLDYTRLSNDRTGASKTDAESETYLQMQLSYLHELFS